MIYFLGYSLIEDTEVVNLILQKPGKYYLNYGFEDLAKIRYDWPLFFCSKAGSSWNVFSAGSFN